MPPCSLEYPCRPDELGSSFISVLLTLPFLGWVGLRFTAVVAAGAELMVMAHDLWYPSSRLAVVHLAVVALVAVCVVLARRVRAEPMRFRPTAAQYTRAVVLLVAGLAVAGYTFHRQVDADAQTRAARIVTLTVTARLGDDAIAVDTHGVRWTSGSRSSGSSSLIRPRIRWVPSNSSPSTTRACASWSPSRTTQPCC
ncbi:hypothetical protein ACPPVO_32820 [Dactylosporangium sp. McL0621]|uniref:hypothetical protein n=1 Tax=Dactylosporangium sp. McL0621 TaxID=3415678 RepID=UPI003CF33530